MTSAWTRSARSSCVAASSTGSSNSIRSRRRHGRSAPRRRRPGAAMLGKRRSEGIARQIGGWSERWRKSLNDDTDGCDDVLAWLAEAPPRNQGCADDRPHRPSGQRRRRPGAAGDSPAAHGPRGSGRLARADRRAHRRRWSLLGSDVAMPLRARRFSRLTGPSQADDRGTRCSPR
ncbi:MAG: hypothetical protein WDW38_006497 [Sanguina aurantia]